MNPSPEKSPASPPRLASNGGGVGATHNYMPELIMALCGINPICERCEEPLGLCKCKPKDPQDEQRKEDKMCETGLNPHGDSIQGFADKIIMSDAEIEELMNQEPLPEGWTEFAENETAFQKVKRIMEENKTD